MLSQQMMKVVSAYMRGLGTPLAIKLEKTLAEGRFADYVGNEPSPADYTDPHLFRKDAAAASLLRKLRNLPVEGVDRRKKAIDTFYECEKQNYVTNRRLSRYVAWFESGFYGDEVDLKLYEFLREVRSEVRSILGPLPRTLSPVFGPGSTYHDKGEKITIPHKMTGRPARTAKPWWLEQHMLFDTAWGRAILRRPRLKSRCQLVQGNRFSTVPKDWSKDRGICIEPSLNVCYQLAVGRHLKEALANAGNDLEQLQSVHRNLARFASIEGTLATIDLSNASDTVSYQLVKLLLPELWFDLLDDLRSPFTQLEGRWIKLEKFSSMGNGYTFELETVIFLALSRVVSRHIHGDSILVSVYGDDIIVPTECYDTLLALLALLGLTPNRAKSFGTGPFRESCGGDYFMGVDVRPLFIKEEPYDPASWISLANGIRRVAGTDILSDRITACMLKPWLLTLDFIPSDIRRLRGPASLGDIVIHDAPGTWQTRGHHRGHRWIRTYQPISRKVSLSVFHPEVQLASALYGVPSSGAAVRDGISGYRKRWSVLTDATNRGSFY